MITVAGAEDIDAIVAIEAAAFDGSAWSRGLVAAEVGSDRHVVLVTGGREAYAAISVVGDVADLDRIAVMPGSRGRGYARALLDDALERARDLGAERMLLEVAADNVAAIGLYESCGFDAIGRRAGYYPNQIDALVMELAIQEWR